MKFMQWYISKLISTNNLSNDQETNLSYFEDIFDDCPKHDINESINISNLKSGVYFLKLNCSCVSIISKRTKKIGTYSEKFPCDLTFLFNFHSGIFPSILKINSMTGLPLK